MNDVERTDPITAAAIKSFKEDMAGRADVIMAKALFGAGITEPIASFRTDAEPLTYDKLAEAINLSAKNRLEFKESAYVPPGHCLVMDFEAIREAAPWVAGRGQVVMYGPADREKMEAVRAELDGPYCNKIGRSEE
jgi:hypothetical protein